MASPDRLRPLVALRARVLRAIRAAFDGAGYSEVTPMAITNFGGVCEDIDSLFDLDYYGRRGYLAQTAQLQLEFLVCHLRSSVWSSGRSFRYEKRGTAFDAYLAEFVLVELEVVGASLEEIIAFQRSLVRTVLQAVLEDCKSDIVRLGGCLEYLGRMVDAEFPVLTYRRAVEVLAAGGHAVEYGDNFDRRQERALLALASPDRAPLFLTHFPSSIKYFNMKRTEDETLAINVDLLAPPFGEISGGAEREVSLERLQRTFAGSNLPAAMRRLGIAADSLNWYYDLFRQRLIEERAGFGLGFERFVAFLLFDPARIDHPVSLADFIEFPRTPDILVP